MRTTKSESGGCCDCNCTNCETVEVGTRQGRQIQKCTLCGAHSAKMDNGKSYPLLDKENPFSQPVLSAPR